MVFIRADANSTVGTGHMMRCFSIGKAFEAAGKKCVFITADHCGDALVERYGFMCICLESAWDDLDREISSFMTLLRKHRPELVLLDSYFVTEEYLQAVSTLTTAVYMDDLGAGPWPAQIVVNYNIFASVLDYSGYAGKKTRLLLGPRYVPLRDEFSRVGRRVTSDTVTDILVSAGGSDPQGIAERIMLQLCVKPKWKMVRFHFLLGALNPRIGELKAISCRMDNVILHIDETRVSDIMMRCDAAVAAAGSTLYELCACAVPAIVYSLADNQMLAAQIFDKEDIMLSAGDCRDNAGFISDVEARLSALAEGPALRRQLSARMRSIVDGMGAQRLVSGILAAEDEQVNLV